MKKENITPLLFRTIFPLGIALASLYYVFLTLRRLWYRKDKNRQYRLPGVTISVGNILVGGTGKTPTIISLARDLTEKNVKVVVLSRGYKSGLKKQEHGLYRDQKLFLTDGVGKQSLICADEAKLINFRTGCDSLFGVNRVAAAKWYLSFNEAPDYWILDDGFQHLKIYRDYDLLLFDWLKNLRREYIFPLGLLREPLSFSTYADSILFTRANGNKITPRWANSYFLNQPQYYADEIQVGFFRVFEKSEEIEMSCQDLVAINNNFILVCGVANPKKIISQISSSRLTPKETVILSDHGKILESNLQSVGKLCPTVLTTEKDYYRASELLHSSFDVVIIKRIYFEISENLIEDLTRNKLVDSVDSY